VEIAMFAVVVWYKEPAIMILYVSLLGKMRLIALMTAGVIIMVPVMPIVLKIQLIAFSIACLAQIEQVKQHAKAQAQMVSLTFGASGVQCQTHLFFLIIFQLVTESLI
jgi:hypothetical protein